jgi:hypothetical protein
MSRTILVLAILAVLAIPPVRAQDQCVVVDDFSRGGVGTFPEGWRARKDSGKEMYKVADEGGRRFLHADVNNAAVQVGKKFEWDLKEYPVLTWAWRAVEFPRGSDERTGKNDSAAAVYAVFPGSAVSVKSVKYIWSEKVPKGTHIPQTRGNTQGLVLRTGGDGEWVEERVNVADHYKKYFRTDELPKPEGIGLLTDGDDTGSRSRGDYTRFRVCKS